MLSLSDLCKQRDFSCQVHELTISNRLLTTMVSVQSEQLTQMERMLQANLSNTQMAPRTGVHQTKAPPVNRQEAREQLRRACILGSGPGGLYGPSNPVQGLRSRRSRMEDVD